MPLEAGPPRPTRRPRVFLSYGWQDNRALVLRLKDDLAADGWDVWLDKDRISGGDAFTAEIEDGIRWCDVLLALMGPHSTRRANDPGGDRRDSICHREISMADTVKGHGRTVPVLACPCTPPLLLQGLDYLDMTDCPADAARYARALDALRAALEDALAGRVRYRAWYANLRPIDFRGVLREKAAGFHARAWLFEEIDRWREAGTTRSLLILGDPGVGKSAVAARLVEREPRVAGHFFCKHDEANTLEPGRLVQTLAAHLAASVPAYFSRLDDPVVRERLDAADRDPVAALTQGLFGPLAALDHPADDVRYLVIDALDEALEHAAARNLVHVLSSALPQMPAWLRLIATARNEPGVTERLRGLRFQLLDANSPRNQADVRAYVAARLGKVPGATADHVETLCRVSNNNFLYVVQTLDDIDHGHLTLAGLERLPPGLVGRYRTFFERQFASEADFEPMRRVLDVMVAAVVPLRENELAEVTGLDTEEALPRLGRRLRQYLKHQDDWGRDPVYAFFHKSLSDWLTDPGRRGDEFTASVRKGHQALAAWLFGRFREERTRWPPYLVRHLPTHLLACKRWDDLAVVLSEPAYLEARTEAGDLAGLLADLVAATGPAGLQAEHPGHRLLALLAAAVPPKQHRIGRDATRLFQCLWNACRWADAQEGPKVATWLEAWRAERRQAGRRAWVRSLRPPGDNLAERELVIEGGGVDHAVRLWGRDSGKQRVGRAGQRPRAGPPSWTRDGQVQATPGNDHVISLLDQEGQPLARLVGHQGRVVALCWSDDCRVLASGSFDATVRLWDRGSGLEVARNTRHDAPVYALAWSADGQVLASGSLDGTIRAWTRDGLEEIAQVSGEDGISQSRRRIEVEHVGDVAVVTFPDRNALARDAEVTGQQLVGLVDLAGCTRLLLNFSNTENMSSDFLRSLLALYEKAQGRGGRLVLCCLPWQIDELFRVTGLGRLHTILPDEHQALQCF